MESADIYHEISKYWLLPICDRTGKRAHFAHYFKIDLLVFNGSVNLKQ